MASSSMNLFPTFITILLISSIADAAVNCQNQLLWSQSLSVNATAQGFDTVALSADGSTVFATAYNKSFQGPSYLVGISTNGSGNALVYGTQSAVVANSSPVVVNSTTVAWATYDGGADADGTLVLTNIETSTSSVPYSFDAANNGVYSHPYFPSAITFDSNSNTIYGATQFGGPSNGGVLFSYNLQSSQYQTLYNFTSSVYAVAIVLSNNALYVTLRSGGSYGDGSIGFYNLSTSSFTELYNFSTSGASGYHSCGAVAVSSSGDVVYGTTNEGGSTGNGTLFSLNVSSGLSEFTLLYNFASNAGSPFGGIVLDEPNGLLYGTVSYPTGGVFSYDLNTNEMAFLYNFTSAGGNEPYSGVALSADKTTLYGITYGSGSNADGPAVFYSLNASCIAPPVTTTAAPTTTSTPTQPLSPTTTTSTPTQSLSPTTTTSTPTQPSTTLITVNTTKSTPKTGSVNRFDGSPSLIMPLILSLAVLVLFH